MSKSVCVVLLMLLPLTAAAQDPDALSLTYQYLLATAKTERELAPVTDHIIKDDSLPYPDLTDFAAEVLLARLNDKELPPLCKHRLIHVLIAAKSNRYDPVLEQVRDRAQEPSVATWARVGLKKWARLKEPEFVPGTIDIRAPVAQVEALALAAIPTTAQGQHLSQFPGGSIDDLFAWAGPPHQIFSNQNIYRDPVIRIKVNRIAFYYRGVGRVLYGFNTLKKEWLFHSIVVDPLAFEDELPYRSRAAELSLPDSATLEMIQLVSNYTAAMKNAIEINYRRGTRPLEFMDTAAEILAAQVETANDVATIDMYAWICRLLTQYGGQRYAAVLENVASRTSDDKLKQFAQLRIRSVAGVPAEPYVPGTISLAAQRAKYPPLYPQSTFQSGRL